MMLSSIVVCKIVGMLILSLGSYIIGILPVSFGFNRNNAKSLLLSILLCFGGGVLLSTSFLHILPESRKTMPDWADIFFCIGFFLLYLVDEFIKLITGGELEEDEQLIRHSTTHTASTCPVVHDNQTEERERQKTRSRFGILLAISVHSVIEGSAIGVQTVPDKVLLLVSAVATHKLVVAFCIGIELTCDNRTFASLSHYILIFSLGTSVGIISGMLIDSSNSIIVPILQALAAGSLLYVSVMEVLPRERSRFKTNETSSLAGIYQFISLVSGFVLIYMSDIVL